ncbi:hypothetical protein D3C77_453470 [compost metagenome]
MNSLFNSARLPAAGSIAKHTASPILSPLAVFVSEMAYSLRLSASTFRKVGFLRPVASLNIVKSPVDGSISTTYSPESAASA